MEVDVKNSIDSDTSDSWSVIDINDSEHVSECEATDSTPVAVNLESNTKGITENIGRHDAHKPGETVEDLYFTNISSDPGMSFSNDHSDGHHDFQVLYKGRVFQNECSIEQKESEFNCSKTSLSDVEKFDIDSKIRDIDNDTDSISIISGSECNDVKCSAYETDENWEDKLFEPKITFKTHPNVLKRKRKRLKLNYRGSSEESISSDFMVPDGDYYSNVQNIDYKKSNNEIQVREYKGAPVYRHYRNNVANTVLSLTMGIIFTGVACIAVGHFLGVHDAQQTAGEMMATLKRLQMENVILHTRLAQLSRAFFSRGNNKIELLSKDEPEMRNCVEKYIDVNDAKKDVNENDVRESENIKNQMIFPERTFSLRAEGGSDNFIHKDPANADEILGQTHDQQNFYNISKLNEEYTKIPRSTTVISKRFLPSENIVQLNKKILKLGNLRENNRARRWILRSVQGSNAEFQTQEGDENQDCIAVREKDLSKFQWFLMQKKKERKSPLPKADECKETVYEYKYPQPESYYKGFDGVVKTNKKNQVALEEPRDGLKSMIYDREPDYSNFWNFTQSIYEKLQEKILKKRPTKIKQKSKERKRQGRKLREGRYKIDDSLVKTRRLKKNAMKVPRKFDDDGEKELKDRKKYKSEFRKKNRKIKKSKKNHAGSCEFKSDSRKNAEDNKYSGRRKVMVEGERIITEREKGDSKTLGKKSKRWKKNFNKRVNRLRCRRDFRPPSNVTVCAECVDKLDNWFSVWMKAREKQRRSEKINNWLFDRSTSRAYTRIGDAYWQFNRAFDRENRRNGENIYFRKRGDKYSYHKGFPSDAYSSM